MTFLLLFLIIDFLILRWWYNSQKKKGKELAWYWGWIMPSDVFFSIIMIVLAAILTLSFVIEHLPLGVKQTENEMKKIQAASHKFYQTTGESCLNLNILIGRNPLRKEWKLDYWGSPYQFNTEDCQEYGITSLGPDKQLGTEDDMVVIFKLVDE